MTLATYMYHCHVEAAEHMQMGMLGNLLSGLGRIGRDPAHFLAPGGGGTASAPLGYAYQRWRWFHALRRGIRHSDGWLRSGLPPADLTFQSASVLGDEDRYFLLNGRSYPETTDASPTFRGTVAANGVEHKSQPIHSLITARTGPTDFSEFRT